MVIQPTRARRSTSSGVCVAFAAGLSLCAQIPIQDRTTRLLRELTPADAYHSKLFDGLGAETRILDTLQSIELNVLPAFSGPPLPFQEALTRLVCTSDAVLSGVVTSAASHPSSDGLFLFTEYKVRLLTVFRARPGLSISKEQVVSVVRPGGEMTIDGVTVRASHNFFPPLSVGRTYYLMTTSLEPFGTFNGDIATGQFELAAGVVRQLGLASIDEMSARGVSPRKFDGALRTATCQQKATD